MQFSAIASISRRIVLLAVLVPMSFLACSSSEDETLGIPSEIQPGTQDRVTPPTITESEVAELLALQKLILSQAEIVIHDAMTELPEWMSPDDIPFDTDPYFLIDPDQNGATNYLRAIAYSDLSDIISSIPSLNQDSKELTTDQKRLYELNHLLGGVRYSLLDHLYEPQDIEYAKYFKNNVNVYLERVEPIVVELAKARRHQSSQILKGFALDAYGSPSGFRSAAQDLSILCTGTSDSQKVIDAIRMTMDLGMAQRRLGSGNEQSVAASITRFAIVDQIKPALESANDSAQVDRIIDILSEAQLSEQEMPRYLEHAKFEHLQLRQLLHELRTNNFKYDAEQYDYFGLEDDPPTILKAHKLLTTDFIGGYVTNEETVVDVLRESGAKPEQIEDAKQLIEASRTSPRSQDAGAGIIAPAVLASFDSMTARDFDKEIELLNLRYKEIEACVHLPFPDRIDAIAVLQKQWTNEQQWEQCKFLKWYRPNWAFGKFFVKSTILIDGFLCVASIKKYQLENNGEMPEDLIHALKYAGIEKPDRVVDPYSGEAFRMIENKDGEQVLYSIGPDRQDNQCEQVLSIEERYLPTDSGDILIYVFE